MGFPHPIPLSKNFPLGDMGIDDGKKNSLPCRIPLSDSPIELDSGNVRCTDPIKGYWKWDIHNKLGLISRQFSKPVLMAPFVMLVFFLPSKPSYFSHVSWGSFHKKDARSSKKDRTLYR